MEYIIKLCERIIARRITDIVELDDIYLENQLSNITNMPIQHKNTETSGNI